MVYFCRKFLLPTAADTLPGDAPQWAEFCASWRRRRRRRRRRTQASIQSTRMRDRRRQARPAHSHTCSNMNAYDKLQTCRSLRRKGVIRR